MPKAGNKKNQKSNYVIKLIPIIIIIIIIIIMHKCINAYLTFIKSTSVWH